MRGLRSKTHEFYCNCCEVLYDIVVVTETWLCDSVHNNELFPECYNVLRSDRKFSLVNRATGGGVLIAMCKRITFSVVPLPSLSRLVPLIDVVGCRCSVGDFVFSMVALYIPPDVSPADFELFFEAVSVLRG